MKFAQTITVLLAGSVMAMQVPSAQAAVLNYDFSVAIDATSTTLPGAQGSGSFSFDDSRPAFGSYYPIQQLSFQFDGSPSVYTAQDDVAYPAYPLVNNSSGPKFGLDFSFLYKDSTSSIPKTISFNGANVFTGASEPTRQQIGSISYQPVPSAGVPEPSTVVGLLLAGGMSLLVNKKRIAINNRRLH